MFMCNLITQALIIAGVMFGYHSAELVTYSTKRYKLDYHCNFLPVSSGKG